jgi:hypothetical protein
MEPDREHQIDRDKAIVPADNTNLSRRSIEITKSYISRGQGTTRSLWINIRPRNPILKAVTAIPATAAILSMMILMMVIAGFALIAMAIMMASSSKANKTN